MQIKKNEYPDLIDRLNRTKSNLPNLGDRWVKNSIHNLDRHIRHNLATQGRSRPPKLSSATLQIYRNSEPPDGSGIRNHLEINYHSEGGKSIAILGIPLGKPTTVARTQEYGAVIRVTDKMRKFLASQGIFLRADTTHITIPARYFWSMANTRAKTEAIALLEELKNQFL